MNTFLRFMALLITTPATAYAGDPLAGELARMSAEGYELAQRASARAGGDTLTVILLRPRDGPGDRLKVYRSTAGKAKLSYLEPASSLKLSLDPVHAGGKLPDLAGDGSRFIAYHAAFPGLDQRSLTLLRWAGGKLARLGQVSFGRLEDLDGDGKPEVVGRERPLGQFFAVECEPFRSGAQGAFRTRVYALAGGTLAPASARFPELFAGRIAELERRVAAVDPRATDDYGAFLGDALSLYFEHEESGRQREGWRRFVRLFPARAADPAPVRSCLRRMEGELRRRLGIPEDWESGG